ncbi:hypothetical protein BV882_22390 [Streptomyces sp. 46]|nr:hypothetical protein BV882_22390 [Streptomyces sp. 46]
MRGRSTGSARDARPEQELGGMRGRSTGSTRDARPEQELGGTRGRSTGSRPGTRDGGGVRWGSRRRSRLTSGRGF